MTNTTDTACDAQSEGNRKNAIELLRTMIQTYGRYHNHKETMAHVGVAVQMAVFGAILVADTWPPSWVPSITIDQRIVAAICIFGIWAFVHVFVRWQLRQRRVAASWYAAMITTLAKWTVTPPTIKTPLTTKNKTKKDRLKTFIDHIYPVVTELTSDIEIEDYYKELKESLEEQKTRAIGGEVILFFASAMMLLLILYRTLSDP